MINGQRVLAVIPARGGSKRAPRKNIREFRGKPLIQWAAEAAWSSETVDECILSSEDLEILQFGSKIGVRIFARHPWFATDEALNEAVLIECIYRQPNFPTWVVLLQPTSPLRTGADIDACVKHARYGNGCVSVREDGTRNGAVYVMRVRHFLATLRIDDSITYTMPNERSLDIDYPKDFGDATDK